jgi:hypothetical protein
MIRLRHLVTHLYLSCRGGFTADRLEAMLFCESDLGPWAAEYERC